MMIEGSGSIPLTSGSGSGRSKTFVDPVDPDPDSDPYPQHCFEHLGPRGGGHPRLRGRGWGGPNSDDGTETLVLYVMYTTIPLRLR
jgi:hypothetical protein